MVGAIQQRVPLFVRRDEQLRFLFKVEGLQLDRGIWTVTEMVLVVGIRLIITALLLVFLGIVMEHKLPSLVDLPDIIGVGVAADQADFLILEGR